MPVQDAHAARPQLTAHLMRLFHAYENASDTHSLQIDHRRRGFEPGGAVTLPRPCPKVTHIRPWTEAAERYPCASCTSECCAVARTSLEQHKALVLEAFDALFSRRDYAAAERYWSDRYIRHSAHIEPGRDGLFNLVPASPDTLRYENQLIRHGRQYPAVARRSGWTLMPTVIASPRSA
jgi:hypothetical protein